MHWDEYAQSLSLDILFALRATASRLVGSIGLHGDLCVSADLQVVVWHDCDPDSFVALARQAGQEGLPHIPDVPSVFSEWRRNLRSLTLAELREHYGYAAKPGNLFGGERVMAEIPVLSEVSEWAGRQGPERFQAIFLDIKLAEKDLDLIPVLSQQIAELFQHAPFEVFIMSPHESLIVAMQSWFEMHAPSLAEGIIFDFETAGALEGARRLGLGALASGKTPLRRWTSYYREMSELVANAVAAGEPPVQTIVAWTIDDDFQMHALAELGLDGVLTNRPSDLRRMIQSGWAEHDAAISAIVNCHRENRASSRTALCARGPELGLSAALRPEQLIERACAEASNEETRGVFGCGSFASLQVSFEGELSSSHSSAILWDASATEVRVLTELP